ncbi:MAG: hypothetical protein U1D55_14135 [Phycisphaerae bacterium]
MLLQNWIATVPPNTLGDVTGDGLIDESDLGVVLQNWRATCQWRGSLVAPPVDERHLNGGLTAPNEVGSALPYGPRRSVGVRRTSIDTTAAVPTRIPLPYT